jgi:hypothetical protein
MWLALVWMDERMSTLVFIVAQKAKSFELDTWDT